MKPVRVRMVASVGDHVAGQDYWLDAEQADEFLQKGYAEPVVKPPTFTPARVEMLVSLGGLHAGGEYVLPADLAEHYIRQGVARRVEYLPRSRGDLGGVA